MKFSFTLLLLSASVWATVLGDAADQMRAGEWRELTTGNITTVLVDDGASSAVTGYADGGVWDPTSEQFLFIGSDHRHSTGWARFAIYSAATNAWREEPRPSWFGPLTATAMHGYDHNAIDVQNRIFYHRRFGNTAIQRYSLATEQWLTPLTFSTSQYVSVAFGLEFFPDLNSLFVGNVQGGSAHLYNGNTSQWATLSTSLEYGSSALHSVAEYSPVHKIMVFGGGNGNRSFYKMGTNGAITRLNDPPSNFSCSGLAGLLTVDPVSGDFLLFSRGGQFYAHNVENDTWPQQPGSDFFEPIVGGSSNNGAVWGVIAAPISTHGVVMFVKSNRSNSMVYLYKHTETSSMETSGVPVFGNLVVSPNPFKSRTTIVVNNGIRKTEKGKGRNIDLKIFDINGKMVQDLSSMYLAPRTLYLQAEGLSAGIYLLKLNTSHKTITKKLFLQK